MFNWILIIHIPKSITGSKNYWKSKYLDLLAIIENLGYPKLFLTFTANDSWPGYLKKIHWIDSFRLKIIETDSNSNMNRELCQHNSLLFFNLKNLKIIILNSQFFKSLD